MADEHREQGEVKSRRWSSILDLIARSGLDKVRNRNGEKNDRKDTDLTIDEQTTNDDKITTETKEKKPNISQYDYQFLDEVTSSMSDMELLEFASQIYDWYAAAIRRRDREPLGYNSFIIHYFCEGSRQRSVIFGNEVDGYLLGSYFDEVFVPAHFAPKGILSGYKLIRAMLANSRPAALFITDDLVATVRKMKGWKVLPIKVQAKFRDHPVEKTLVINHWQSLPKLASFATNKKLNKFMESSTTVQKLKKFFRKNNLNEYESFDEFDEGYNRALYEEVFATDEDF